MMAGFIGASVAKKKTTRDKLFAKQRKERGFDDSDTWSLDHTLAKWLAPRLKRYKEVNIIVGPTDKGRNWDQILDEMIATFEFLASEERWSVVDYRDKRWKQVKVGLKLFTKYFTNLWW
jgi:hypothetical protein